MKVSGGGRHVLGPIFKVYDPAPVVKKPDSFDSTNEPQLSSNQNYTKIANLSIFKMLV